MPRFTLLLASLTLAACSASHRVERTDSGGVDAGPAARPDSGPVMPMPGCGMEPAVPECRRLCDEACEAFAGCGGDFDACITGCYVAYACPGETPGHDAAICGDEGFPPRSCDATCAWVETFGGGGTGPSCPTATPCRGRSYCDCNAGCEPLIDHTTGCICECDEPVRCGGPECACVCGGATYLGCAPVGECPEPRITCADPAGATVVDGCPVCP